MQICNRATKDLSMSHLVAVKGHVGILEAIKENFGETHANCTKYDNISTAYLLSFFGHDDMPLLWYIKKFRFPNIVFEPSAVLYIKLLFNFKKFVYPRNSLSFGSVSIELRILEIQTSYSFAAVKRM